MRRNGQCLVDDVNKLLGRKFVKYKELSIQCVEYVFENWLKGKYKDDFRAITAVER